MCFPKLPGSSEWLLAHQLRYVQWWIASPSCCMSLCSRSAMKTSIWMNFSSKGHRGACLWVECQEHILDYPSGLCHRQTQKADAAGGGLTSWSTQGGGCGKHAGKKIIIKANACGQRSSLKLSVVLWHLVRLLRTASAEKPSGNFSAEHIRGRVLSPVNVSLCILIGGL